MTLKENITQKVLDLPLVSSPSKREISDYGNGISNLEKIADDYAISFALFLSTECKTNGDKDGWWFYNETWKTTNELLEIFKTEKGYV